VHKHVTPVQSSESAYGFETKLQKNGDVHEEKLRTNSSELELFTYGDEPYRQHDNKSTTNNPLGSRT
jgi:hypothetical protein